MFAVVVELGFSAGVAGLGVEVWDRACTVAPLHLSCNFPPVALSSPGLGKGV